MAIDFTKPTVTDNYSTGILPGLIEMHTSLAKFLDGVTITAGLATGMKKYNASSDFFEQYNGTSWEEMPLAYVKQTSYTPADVLSKLLNVDGASSGLDADMLDGQDGSFYRNASNLNAGTVPSARISGALSGITALAMNNVLTIDGTSGNVSPMIYLKNTNAAGAVIQLEGSGSTPKKFVRAFDGGFDIVNDAYNSQILRLTDTGNLNITGIYSGNGSGLNSLNASQLSSGTVPAARLGGDPVFGTLRAGFLEVGLLGASNTPAVDFHSGATTTDYDARIISIGGNGSPGNGSLQYIAHGNHQFFGDVYINGISLNIHKNFSESAGHQRLPGGLIMCWGYINVGGDSAGAATFSHAFPTACLNVQATLMRDAADGQDNTYAAHVLWKTQSQCGLGVTDSHLSIGTVQVFYFAVGF